MQTAQHLKNMIRTVPDFPKPGISFKDITPLLSDAHVISEIVDALARPFADSGITKVLAIEARGFILGSILAQRLGAGFVPVRKRGKLPYHTIQVEYALEYGTDTIEMHIDAVSPEDRVLIHDDVIATGGTAAACYRLAKLAGAHVVGYAFLFELSYLGGRHLLKHEEDKIRIHAILTD